MVVSQLSASPSPPLSVGSRSSPPRTCSATDGMCPAGAPGVVLASPCRPSHSPSLPAPLTG